MSERKRTKKRKEENKRKEEKLDKEEIKRGERRRCRREGRMRVDDVCILEGEVQKVHSLYQLLT